jgi:hypothetical protein
VTQLPAFVSALADELRRLPCRVDHDKQQCKKCQALAEYDAFIRQSETQDGQNPGQK